VPCRACGSDDPIPRVDRELRWIVDEAELAARFRIFICDVVDAKGVRGESVVRSSGKC